MSKSSYDPDYIRPSWKGYYKIWEECGRDYKMAAEKCGIQKTSLMRAVRGVERKKNPNSFDIKGNYSGLMQEVRNTFSDKELKAFITGKKTSKEKHTAIHDFTGDHIRIGYMTDTHIGSKYCDPKYIEEAFRLFEREDVDIMLHTGDVTEGFYSGRQGHVFECTHIGYEKQFAEALRIYGMFGYCPMYFISGNHDATFQLQNGVRIVKNMCEGIDNATFLGDGEGDLIVQGVNIKLWHGLDGSSYATSYRPQKIIECFTGGEKPHVLLMGHTHKQLYLFDRHIHGVSGGAIQRQSTWMRQKRMPAHTGFWILDIVANEKGVGRFKCEWFPFYV